MTISGHKWVGRASIDFTYTGWVTNAYRGSVFMPDSDESEGETYPLEVAVKRWRDHDWVVPTCHVL